MEESVENYDLPNENKDCVHPLGEHPFSEIVDGNIVNAIKILTDKYKKDDRVIKFFRLFEGEIVNYDSESSFCIFIGNTRERIELNLKEKTNLPQEAPEFYAQIILSKEIFSLVVLIVYDETQNGFERLYYEYVMGKGEGETNKFDNLSSIVDKFGYLMRNSKDAILKCEYFEV